MKNTYFQIYLFKIIRNNSKIPYEIPAFFEGKLDKKFFLFYFLGTHGILHTEFSSIWTTIWPNEKYYI